MLEELGPTFVKFGQLLSTRPDLIPADIIEELVKLRDQVSTFDAEEAAAVIEEEFGLTLERVFEEISDEPIAAASIGQVYRAVLPGGRAAMVKVQRPEAATRVRQDVDLFYQIARMVRDQAGGQMVVDPIELVDEFARAVSRELDYTLEARNAERLHKLFADSESVVVPRVIRPLTTRRVLTLEFIDGPTMNEMSLSDLTLRERRDLAETLTHTWFKQVLSYGFFHADPHPANIVFLSPERIGLLDFGVCGALSEADMENGLRLFTEILDREGYGVKKTLRRLGIRWGAGKDAAMDSAIEDVFSRYYGAAMSEVDPAELLHDAFTLARVVEAKIPSRFLLLEKTLITLEGVVTELYPDLNLFEVGRPYARSLMLRRAMPDAVLGRAARNVTAYREALENYPFQVRDLFDQINRGELRINFLHRGLDAFGHKLDILTNRVVVALVVATLALASAIVAVFVEEGPKLAGLSIWGVPGFLGAFLFGAWLVWAIFRSGRL
jgi:ubiquinone biosynthesis protein